MKLIIVCMHCHKIKTDTGWIALAKGLIEMIIKDYPKIFSHGLCRDCNKEHYPEFCDD